MESEKLRVNYQLYSQTWMKQEHLFEFLILKYEND